MTTEKKTITLTPADQICEWVDKYVGCSLDHDKAKLAELVARDVDDPNSMVQVKTNCGTFALGIWHKVRVADPIVDKKYINGAAIIWLRTIGKHTGSLKKFDGETKPKRGALLRYNTAGLNNDHVEFLLEDPDDKWMAQHGGGGRARNAVTKGVSDIRYSVGRPLVEWWDPDELGIQSVDREIEIEVQEPESQVPAQKPTQQNGDGQVSKAKAAAKALVNLVFSGRLRLPSVLPKLGKK